MYPVEVADLAVPTQHRGEPRTAYEEFAVVSWQVIPGAALCLRGGSLLPSEESISTALFGFGLARKVQIQAANFKISSAATNEKAEEIFPLATLGGGVGHGPAGSSARIRFAGRQKKKKQAV